MKKLVLILILGFSAAALAGKDTFTGTAGAMFNIDSYDPVSQTYELTYLKYPAQGPLITTPEYLAAAIPSINLERIKRNPDSIKDHQYQTDKTIYFLMPEAVQARKKKLAGSDKKSKELPKPARE